MAGDTKTRLLREAEKYVLQGKISQAIGEYLKIVKNDPDDVLILNTVGDLYLRQGKTGEANKLFYQVAENYVRNNFFLKASSIPRSHLFTPARARMSTRASSTCTSPKCAPSRGRWTSAWRRTRRSSSSIP